MKNLVDNRPESMEFQFHYLKGSLRVETLINQIDFSLKTWNKSFIY